MGLTFQPFVSLCGLFSSLILWGCTETASAEQPNILVIIADDMGVEQVGVYGEGSSPAKTPHIDALAAEGVLRPRRWISQERVECFSCISVSSRNVGWALEA